MTRVIVFAKAPVAGLSKTRLMPALGDAGAARLAGAFLEHTLRIAKNAFPGQVELRAEPVITDIAWRHIALPGDIDILPQGLGDLGERLLSAATTALTHADTILLIGTDCPDLTADDLRHAAQQLETHDAVIVPAHDGGYVLLGLRRCDSSLFTDVPWSTSAVCAITCSRLHLLDWSVALLGPRHDIDEPDDLAHLPAIFRHLVTHE